MDRTFPTNCWPRHDDRREVVNECVPEHLQRFPHPLHSLINPFRAEQQYPLLDRPHWLHRYLCNLFGMLQVIHFEGDVHAVLVHDLPLLGTADYFLRKRRVCGVPHSEEFGVSLLTLPAEPLLMLDLCLVPDLLSTNAKAEEASDQCSDDCRPRFCHGVHSARHARAL
ncbi:hypothetical protein ACFVXE_33500 [Streptomyces sp. NPDC058231]|uniref:hypothetical protein n=1 Tax=Streptomyces sp. NPDC058231 TaxID=3346392 RepID=UPI0036EE2605